MFFKAAVDIFLKVKNTENKYLVVVLSHPLARKVTPPHGDTANV